MQKFKKTLMFLFLTLSITIFFNNYTFADENSDTQAQSAAAGSLIGEKLDIITLQTGNLFGIVNGKKVKLESVIQNTDKQLLIPAKFLTQTLGGKYAWNSKNKTITISTKGTIIIYQINNKFATINGKKIQLDKSAVTIKNINMIPLKLTAETLGAKYK